jgi:hypothetical protein
MRIAIIGGISSIYDSRQQPVPTNRPSKSLFLVVAGLEEEAASFQAVASITFRSLITKRVRGV